MSTLSLSKKITSLLYIQHSIIVWKWSNSPKLKVILGRRSRDKCSKCSLKNVVMLQGGWVQGFCYDILKTVQIPLHGEGVLHYVIFACPLNANWITGGIFGVSKLHKLASCKFWTSNFFNSFHFYGQLLNKVFVW